jgi:uncharacterized protein involved in exopolysaccharide biosynthesis
MAMTNKYSHSLRISLRDVFFILFYKIHVFLGTFLLVAALVIGYTFISHPVYRATGSVLVKPFFDSSQRLQTQDRFDVLPVSQQDINTEINIMTSDALLRRVVEQLEAERSLPDSMFGKLFAAKPGDGAQQRAQALEEAVLLLRKQIEIKPVAMASIIDVGLKGANPREITTIVNTFLNLYIDHHIEVHRPGGGVHFYTEQAENARTVLLEAETELMQLHKNLGIIQIEEERLNNIELMRVLKESASLIKADINRTETILKHLQPFLRAEGQLTVLPAELRDYEPLIDLQKALIPLMVEKERIALMYPDSSVEYQDIQNQVQRIADEIRMRQLQVLGGVELDLAALVNRKLSLEEDIRRIEHASRLLTQHETERNRLIREVAQKARTNQLYAEMREDALIQSQRERSRVSNVSVTSWAGEPSTPVFPKKALMTALALLAGLLTGLGSAFAAYFMDHSIKRPEEMERWFQIPVFAAIEEIEAPAQGFQQPQKMQR